MLHPSTRTVFVLAFLLHNILAFSQNPDCPNATFFKTLGSANQAEFGTVLIGSTDGNLYLAGRNGLKTFIQKTSPSGNPIWYREFQISPFESLTLIQLIEDSEGMLLGCGTHALFAGVSRGVVFRYNPVSNTVIWSRSVVSSNPSAAGILEKSTDGSFVYYQNLNLPNGQNDIEILNLERNTGNIIPAFANRYEHISYDVIAKMVDVDGSLYALGTSESVDSFQNNKRMLLLTRLNPVSGVPIWAKLAHISSASTFAFVANDLIADGNDLLCAYVGNEHGGPNQVYLLKTNTDEMFPWGKKYDVDASNIRVISVPDGFILSGQRSNGWQYFAFKVDKNGDMVWGRELGYGVPGGGAPPVFGPDQSVVIGDSLYITGSVDIGLTNVLLWKMYTDGTMADSCSQITDLNIEVTALSGPIAGPITLHHLLSTATANSINMSWTSTGGLPENEVCPNCTVPDPCPEDNDFAVEILGISCSGGFVNMNLRICELAGGEVPPLSISFYNANPFTEPADKLGTYDYNQSGPDSCVVLQLVNLENLFGANAIQSGAQIFAVVNDLGFAFTPFDPADFPLSDLEECDYANNLDSITVALPTPPALNIGPDISICANEAAVLDAGPGFFRYQWSNGSTTQTTTVMFPGQYRITATDFCGSRQFDTISIVVQPLSLLQENAEFCPGKSVTVRGFTFNQAGIFQRTIPGQNGECDTSATFFISQLPYEERIEVINFCPFQTVTINGVVYDHSGLVRDTVPSATTCDTIVFYFLNQLPLPFRTYNFEICPGDSVVFNGQVYYQTIAFTDTLRSTGFGCDTVAYVAINLLQQIIAFDTIQFCPGSSVVINGQSYTQPGAVQISLPSSVGECDTLLTYTLEWLPAPMRDETLLFCQGSSVDIGGQTYTQPGTVLLTIPGSGGGCDTLVTYTLAWLPQPTRSETLEFCAGESISLGGQTYTQPGTVNLIQPGLGGDCDTLVTYTLQYLIPPPSNMSLICPPQINVATSVAAGGVLVNYNQATAASDCVCPGIAINLSGGLPSGNFFPIGDTQVCFAAQDSCASVSSCCFLVRVTEEDPCDTKTSGCIKYDLLSISADAKQRLTYRIRVTNNCNSELIYTAIQLPNGATATSPVNLSNYLAPSGREYAVRNPNYSPFYSIRFKPNATGISNGQSDVFEYTLPAQVNPTFIHITTRVAAQTFHAAHLNVFNCPLASSNRNEEPQYLDGPGLQPDRILLFPNPSSGDLFADLSRWEVEMLNMRVIDAQGRLCQSFTMSAGSEIQAIPIQKLPPGLYFLEIVSETGARETARFMIQR